MRPKPVLKPYRRISAVLLALVLWCGNAFSQLQANFTTDKTGGCSPIAVAFTNTTTGASGNAVYSWDLGNGNTAASRHAGAIYKDEQTYTVTLTVRDGNQTSVKTQNITVYGKPGVDFTASQPKVCIPTAATFMANTTGGGGTISSWYWDFGDGTTQQGFGNTQTHSYSLPQKATVSLTVTNNFGCTNTIQKKNIVEILPALRAVFNASQTILCRETDPVQFTNSSSGPGTLSYLWDFGDGTTSTDITPSHVYNKKGIFTVKLTVTSSEGCVVSSTQAAYINVNTFTSDFNVPTLLCENSYHYFSSISTPYTSNVSWQIDGSNNVYFGNSIGLPLGVGDHTIKLRNTFGTCADSITKTVSVKPVPLVTGFTDTTLGACGAPVTVNFKDTTATAVKWNWNFNAVYYPLVTDATTQAASYVYTNDGGYIVRLVVENVHGCTAATTKYIGITRPSVSIVANGTIANCGPYAMKMTAITTEEIISYKWVFSDGATSTDKEPEHLFNTEGFNNVQLTYITKSGCTGTVSTSGLRVYKKPDASFTASSTTICGNTPVSFNANPQGGSVSFLWYLGDNPNNPIFNYSIPSLTHQFYYDSTYSITLIASNGGCSDTVTRKDYVKILPPFPKIGGPINTCDGTRGLVTFPQLSKKANSWTWFFGDGNTTTVPTEQPDMKYTYTKTGTYLAVLSVTNGQCTVRDSTIFSVLLKQQPLLTASAAAVCYDNRLDIKIASLERNPRGTPSNNHYNIQRTEYSDQSQFTGSLSSTIPGFYWTTEYTGNMGFFDRTKNGLRFILRSDVFGCADTTNTIPLAINGAYAGFEIVANNICFKSPAVFKDTSRSFGNTIKSWLWNFGDGNTLNTTQGGTVTHKYDNPGNYYVTVRVTDDGGCSSTSPAISYVTVNGPKAAFSVSSTNTTITLPVYFYNYTNNYNSFNTQYQWDFGDGGTSTVMSPTYAFANPGTYTVRLIATNPTTLCGDTVTQKITVNNFGPAFTKTTSFIGSRNCPPVLARFTNNSINYTRVTWDFGDGNTADNLNFPSHIYEKPGRYEVTLYVYGPGGLTATHKDSVVILQPEATIHANNTLEGCIGHVMSFTSITKNTSQYAWDFGDGAISSPGDSLTSHKYMTAGTYKPSLLVTQAGGCPAVAALSDKVIIRPDPVVAVLPAQPLACLGTPIQLTASGGVTYSWSPVTGLSDPNIAAPMASPTATTNYTVLVKDNIGCSATGTTTVKVITPLKLTASADTFVCKGSPVQLRVSGADLYTWIGNTTGLSGTQINNPIAVPTATTQYTVVGADMYHCFTDTAIINVNVIPLPTVKASAGALVYPGTQVPLSATPSNDVLKWKWSPATYLNCTSCLTPTSTVLADIVYTIKVETKEGCVASDSTVIKVICEEAKVSIPTAFTPNNDQKNDVFLIKGISVVKHLIIYNRWGNKVYERSNYIAADRSTAWDGTVNGTPAPEGAYVYFAEMQCPSGGVFVRKGSVVLTR
jgi:gliding motility-associated-like protein